MFAEWHLAECAGLKADSGGAYECDDSPPLQVVRPAGPSHSRVPWSAVPVPRQYPASTAEGVRCTPAAASLAAPSVAVSRCAARARPGGRLRRDNATCYIWLGKARPAPPTAAAGGASSQPRLHLHCGRARPLSHLSRLRRDHRAHPAHICAGTWTGLTPSRATLCSTAITSRRTCARCRRSSGGPTPRAGEPRRARRR
jgi:hypothetical protein